MYKKNLMIITSLLTLNNCQLKTNSENNDNSLGAALFAATTIGMTVIARQAQLRKNQEDNKIKRALHEEIKPVDKDKIINEALQGNKKISDKLLKQRQQSWKNETKIPLLTYTSEWHHYQNKNYPSSQQATIQRKINILLPYPLIIPCNIAQKLYIESSQYIDPVNDTKTSEEESELESKLKKVQKRCAKRSKIAI